MKKQLIIVLTCVSVIAGVSAKHKKMNNKKKETAAKESFSLMVDNGPSKNGTKIYLKFGGKTVTEMIAAGRSKTFSSKEDCLHQIVVKQHINNRWRYLTIDNKVCGDKTLKIMSDASGKGFSIKLTEQPKKGFFGLFR